MANDKVYRVGLVGFRGRGRGLANFWNAVPNAKLVALADDVKEHCDEAKELFPGLQTFNSHKEMLDNADIDILTVGTRPKYRPPIVKDGAETESVKAIYVEKPIANSLDQATAMIEQCKKTNTVFTVGNQRRWCPAWTKVRNSIKEGFIGRRSKGYAFWATSRVGSNGTHFFDAINFVLDSTPVEAIAKLDNKVDLTKMDDSPLTQGIKDDPGGLGVVTYDNDVRISYEFMPDTTNDYTFIFCGTKGRIEFNNDFSYLEYRARDEDSRSFRGNAKMTTRNFEVPETTDEIMVSNGYKEMIHCIETGAKSSSSGEIGRQALELIVAFHLSSEAGTTPINLPLAKSAHSKTLNIT